MVSRAARANHESIERQLHVQPLLLHFLYAHDIAQPANRVRTATRDDVALATERGDLLRNLRHCRAHIRTAGYHGGVLDAHQLEHEIVAASFLPVAAGYALLDHEAALEPFLDRGGEGDAAMIGLRRAAGDQRIGTLCQRIRRQELKFAGLVAAGKEAQQIVTLDPDLRTDAARATCRQCFGKVRKQLNRRGGMSVAATRKTGQIQSINSSESLQFTTAATPRERRACKRLFRVEGTSDATARITGRVCFIRHSLDEPLERRKL